MDLSGLRQAQISLAFRLFPRLDGDDRPCTMATNIAALAYVGRNLTDRKYSVVTAAL